jgi:hypothetical protein
MGCYISQLGHQSDSLEAPQPRGQPGSDGLSEHMVKTRHRLREAESLSYSTMTNVVHYITQMSSYGCASLGHYKCILVSMYYFLLVLLAKIRS